MRRLTCLLIGGRSCWMRARGGFDEALGRPAQELAGLRELLTTRTVLDEPNETAR